MVVRFLVFLFSLMFAANAFSGVNGPFKLINDTLLLDQSGRLIDIQKPYKRIISLYGAHTENLFYLGLDREIIGVTATDHYPEMALTKTVFSYHDDPEKFLAVKPDLVLIRPMIDRGYAKLTARLEKSGIAVVSIQPATISEMYRYWEVLGALTGKRDASKHMINSFQCAVEKYREHIKTIEKRKTVYFEAMHDQMKTFSRGSMADFVLKTAGGINIADDGSPSRGTNIAIYGKEKILEKAADIDVFLSQKGAMNQPTKESIKNEPGFAVIKAIKNDRIYIVDEVIVSRPTIRLLQGIYEIGMILYPEFSDAGWQQIFKEATGT